MKCWLHFALSSFRIVLSSLVVGYSPRLEATKHHDATSARSGKVYCYISRGSAKIQTGRTCDNMIIHREDYRVKLIDFGLAKELDAHGRVRTGFAGTVS